MKIQFFTVSNLGKSGENPALPRNCEGNETRYLPLSHDDGKAREVGRPKSGDLIGNFYQPFEGEDF